MGILGNIWVKLGLKSDDFRKGMDQSEQKVSKFGQATQKMSMLAKAAWVAVGAAVIKFGKEAIKAYNEQMAANAKLENAIKNTNGALGLEFRELEKFASQIQSSFNVADDAAMNAMSTMTTFKTITGETFKQAMLAAVDMASFMKTDLNSAVMQLGKALEIPEIGLSMLRRSGVVFTNEQIANVKKLVAAGKQYEAQQLILIEVQKKFGGAAAAAAETAGGKWTGFKMAVGDLMETLGSGIEKTKGVANALKEVVEYTNYILSSKHLSAWEKFWGTMGLQSTKQQVYDKALKAAAAEEKKLKEISDAAQGAADKYKTIEEVQNRISQIQRKNNDKNSIIQSVQIELKELELLESKLQGLIIKRSEEEEAANSAAEAAAQAAAEANVRSKQILNNIQDQIAALQEKKQIATSLEEIAAINDEIAALEQLKEGYEKVSAAMLEMSKTPIPSVTGGDVTGKVTTTKQQGVDIDALTKKYGKQKKEVQEIEQSFMRITDAVYRITSSGLELGEMFGLDPEIARALNDMVGSVLDIVDAMDAVTKATNSAAEAIGGVGTSMGQTGSAVLAVFGALISISSAIAKIDMAMQQANLDERVARINSELLRVKHLVDDIGSSMGEGWFVTDNFEKVKGLNAELTTLASHAAVAMKQWVNSFADFLASSDDWRKYVKTLLGDVTDLANQINSDAFASALSGQMLGNIDALNDALKQMEELAQEGTDAEKAMAAAAIELLEQAIGTYDELRSTISAMVGDISGTLYNTVTVEWKKIWMENRDAGAESFEGIAEAAKKNIADIMETLVTQQIWASVMAPVFDQLGTNLTNAIVGGGDITGVFDQFFAGFDAQLEGYYGALDQFYTEAEARGWEFSNPNETTTSSTTSQEDALDKLVEKQKLLNELYEQWIELYGQETADAMLAGMGSDANSYVKALEDSIAELDALREAGTITDEQLQQLKNFQDQLLGIRDAAKQAAAEAEAEAKAASQAAYDAWSANLQAGLNSAGDQYEQLLAYEAAIKAAVEDTSMSEADRAKAIQEATAAQEELYKQVREGLESTYATDDDKWAAQQEKYRKDIEWATNNGLPALAQKIQDTWDAEVIKRSTEAMDDWKSSVDEALSGIETGRVDAIIKAQQDYVAQALASGGMPSVKKLMYFAELMQAEQKSLNEKYETEEEKHLKTLAEYDADYNDAKLLGDEELMAKILAERQKYNDEYIQQAKDNASAEVQAALEGSDEYKALTGDLAKLGVQEARKALDAYRKMVENSTDLSDEAKEEILAGLDKIQEKIDNIELDNLQQQFEDIQSVISSISSILSSFGASSELTEGLSGLSTVIGGLFTVLSGGTWVAKLSGVAAMIGGIVVIVKSLKGVFSDGNEDLTAGVTKLSAAYQKLVGIMNKAFGDNKTSLQNQAIDNIKAQIAEYQKLIDKELAKGNGFLARLFGLDTDEEAIAQYEKEIEKLFGDIAALEEEQKRDFLQTDTDSFVSSLRDIWAQSYDSAEDYYSALKKLNQTTIDDIIARWIEKKLVEDQVNNSLQKLYDSGLNDSSFELFSSEIQAISDAAKAEYERWQQAGYFQGETESSMDGSIARTATEAQFNQYLGYIQNINITAHDILNAVKNQPVLIDFTALIQVNKSMANDLKRTADNTEYCKMLEVIKNDISAIRRGGSVAYN